MNEKIKILIAEDEALIAHWLKMELETAGFNVISLVATGEEAISEALTKNPDVILLDLYLIGSISGVEAAQKITAQKDIPIIVMTGYDDKKISEDIKSFNPVARLQKPVRIEEIKRIIISIIKK